MEKWEQKTLIDELLQGMELGKQLRTHLTATSSPETKELLVQRILTSYDKALMILNWRGAMVQTPGATTNAPESPLSNKGSPWNDNSEEDHQEHQGVSKKRKVMPTWTDRARINSENEAEGTHEDGYSWRKYGQKGILGAKHPRSYYRCTFRKSQNCWATKKVQRSEDDPPVLDVTYRGRHTCTHADQSIQIQAPQESISNFRDNKETEPPFPFASTSLGCTKSENHTLLPCGMHNNHLLGCYSPSTPEINKFLLPTGQMNCSGGLGDIMSSNTPAANSPIINLDFSLDHVEIDPFDTPGFFC